MLYLHIMYIRIVVRDPISIINFSEILNEKII